MIAFIKPPGTSQARGVDELLAEFRATGAQAPFEELVRRYAAMVFSECYAVTKSRHDAEDAAQATFLTLAVQARTGEEIRHLGPWLQRVARRVALDQEKAKRRRKKREDNHHRVNGSTGLATPERLSMDQLELRHLINDELQELPAKYRMPLILHYFGGLTREQMAKELKCKPATLGVRLFRAREMLGKRLAKRGIIMPAAAIPIGIAAVVRESVEQHGIMAMAASASQIAEAASRVASGLTPRSGIVSVGAMSLAQSAANDLIVRKVKAIIAAAAIGGSALLAGGATVVKKIQSGSLTIESLFDLSGYFRSLTAPSVPRLHVDASQRWDYQSPAPQSWPAGLQLKGEGSLELATISIKESQTFTSGSSPVYSSSNVDSTTQHAAAATPRVIASSTATSSDVRTLPVSSLSAGNNWSLPVRAGAKPTLAPLASTGNGGGNEGMITGTSGGSGGWGKYGFIYDPNKADNGTTTNGPTAENTDSSGTTVTILPVPPVGGATSSTTGSYSGVTYDSSSGRETVPTFSSSVGLAGSLSGASYSYSDSTSTGFTPVVAGSGSTLNLTVSAPSSNSISASGNVLRGWGTADVAGTLDMSGIVVADGFSRARTLDLTNVARVINSVPNSPTGINGWYAQRGGKLVLPTLSVAAGTSTIEWGDTTANNGRLDLVNALQLTVHNAVRAGMVEIALLAPDRAEIPAIPAGYDALTVWSVSGLDQVDASGVDITARYALPGSSLSGPLSGLNLFYFDGDEWRSASATIDASKRLISAEDVPVQSMLALFTVDATDRGLTYTDRLGFRAGLLAQYAVAGTYNGLNVSLQYSAISTTQSDGDSMIVDWRGGSIRTRNENGGGTIGIGSGTVVPEPGALTLFVLGAPMMLRRRRRS